MLGQQMEKNTMGNFRKFMAVMQRFNFASILTLIFSLFFVFVLLVLCLSLKAFIAMIFVIRLVLMGGFIENFARKYDQYSEEEKRKTK